MNLDDIFDDVQMVDCTFREAQQAKVEILVNVNKLIEAAIEAEREACAKVAENGNFLHDAAPDARFGKSCAAAIRERSKAQA